MQVKSDKIYFDTKPAGLSQTDSQKDVKNNSEEEQSGAVTMIRKIISILILTLFLLIITVRLVSTVPL